MSAVHADHAEECAKPAAGAFLIPPPDIDQYWIKIDRILKQAESWTQIISLSEIREQIDTNHMLAWGVLDSAGQFGLAVARLHDGDRGTICTAWIVLPLSIEDDASICALLNEVEAFARFRGAAALEVLTAPWSVLKVQANLRRARLTAAILEVDLRVPLRTN